MAKIMVVEDELLGKHEANLLGKLGHDVYAEEDGSLALELMENEGNFTLLITGLQRSRGPNGKWIVEEMRKRPSLRNIPVIIASGLGNWEGERIQDVCYKLGVFYLEKPWTLEEFYDLVDRALKR